MLIASRVLKTWDSIETRAFKTRFTRFASPLMWKLLPRGDFKLLLILSLSISQTLSEFKHQNQSNAHRQMLTVLSVQRKSPSPSTPKSVKSSPSNTHHPRRATKITLTVKRSSLSLNHIPMIPLPIPWKSLLSLPQILLCLKVCFSYKNLSFLNNYSIWV